MPKLFQMEAARWSATGLVTATYIYFLVFAQFGFLHRVRESLGQEYWNLVLGSMGLAGLIGAIVTLVCYRNGSGRIWLRVGFIGATVAAALAAQGSHLISFVLSASLSGLFLSVLTVALVGVLAEFLPLYQVGLVCGLGTGAAYLVSNIPMVFEGAPRFQCWFAAIVCLAGYAFVGGVPSGSISMKCIRDIAKGRWLRFLGWVVVFMVLVWADSAAFTRIQETPELKAASWSGSGQLWSIGIVHFIAALLAGFLMHTSRFHMLLILAFVGLFFGWFGLESGAGGLLPALIYAAAVSFYSTALVGFALIRNADFVPVVLAGLVYGASGWIGSAMGIGMVNNLDRVPVAFWLVAVVALLGGLCLIERKATL